jgi:hypothetical protein
MLILYHKVLLGIYIAYSHNVIDVEHIGLDPPASGMKHRAIPIHASTPLAVRLMRQR